MVTQKSLSPTLLTNPFACIVCPGFSPTAGSLCHRFTGYSLLLVGFQTVLFWCHYTPVKRNLSSSFYELFVCVVNRLSSAIDDIDVQILQHVERLFLHDRVVAGDALCIDDNLRLRLRGLCQNRIRDDTDIADDADQLDNIVAFFLQIVQRSRLPKVFFSK